MTKAFVVIPEQAYFEPQDNTARKAPVLRLHLHQCQEVESGPMLALAKVYIRRSSRLVIQVQLAVLEM